MIEHVFTCLAPRVGATWILEADIKDCFDNISHDWLLEGLLKKRYPKYKGKKVNIIRYADDFIVTAHSREIFENEIAPMIRQFLKLLNVH